MKMKNTTQFKIHINVIHKRGKSVNKLKTVPKEFISELWQFLNEIIKHALCNTLLL